MQEHRGVGCPVADDREPAPHAMPRHPHQQPIISYGDYLGLPQILAAGRPQTVHAAERRFIRIHQRCESCFRDILTELAGARDALQVGCPDAALPHLRRCRTLAELVIGEIVALPSLVTREEFAAFRSSLGSASGLQSIQFRCIELLSGAQDEGWLRKLRNLGTAERAALAAQLGQPSVW
jgi:tryptophan 2,3-dioxygenase